jgi:hypothetical protein
MEAALATLDLATLQPYRADALAALHKLNIGRRSEELVGRENAAHPADSVRREIDAMFSPCARWLSSP